MRRVIIAGAGAFLVSASCASAAPDGRAPIAGTASTAPKPPANETPALPSAANPLLAKWSGSYGGVPPFASVKVEQIKPAYLAAMKSSVAEGSAAIAADPAPPTFDNTIVAFEDPAGRCAGRDAVRHVGVDDEHP